MRAVDSRDEICLGSSDETRSSEDDFLGSDSDRLSSADLELLDYLEVSTAHFCCSVKLIRNNNFHVEFWPH